MIRGFIGVQYNLYGDHVNVRADGLMGAGLADVQGASRRCAGLARVSRGDLRRFSCSKRLIPSAIGSRSGQSEDIGGFGTRDIGPLRSSAAAVAAMPRACRVGACAAPASSLDVDPDNLPAVVLAVQRQDLGLALVVGEAGAGGHPEIFVLETARAARWSWCERPTVNKWFRLDEACVIRAHWTRHLARRVACGVMGLNGGVRDGRWS